MNTEQVRQCINPKLDQTIERLQMLFNVADTGSDADYQRDYDRLISRAETLMELRRELLAVTLTEEGRVPPK
jgi:hypothetical protein